jgi:hypothetical protein
MPGILPILLNLNCPFMPWGLCGCDRMVVVSSNLAHGEVCLMQNYVIKFVGDLRQVCGFLEFLQVLHFPPPIH